MVTAKISGKLLLAACLLWLGGCASIGDDITDLTLEITVAGDVNPDDSGRASPVYLSVFELRDTGTFEYAEYLDLFRDARAALGAGLINTTEIGPLFPDSTRTQEIRINPAATAVGLMGGFNRYNDVKTTVSVAIEPGKDKTLEILIDRRGLHIKE